MAGGRICSRCSAVLDAADSSELCVACSSRPQSAHAASSDDAAFTQTVAHIAPDKHTSRPVQPLPEPGQLLGEYRILRALGKGGMGAVYEADHVETGRRVALKVLKHSLDSPEARKRFFREGRLAASINHPHSVYVFGTEEFDGTPAIVMELVTGGTLQEQVRKEGPLPIGKAIDATLQIIQGLEAAEKLGVLHRDIKPANCFLDGDGNVKIGDFGLSISTEARDQTEVTQAGSLLGTPAYASPEQLRGDELSVQSDMYSVGVTLYYLLTGRLPFESEHVVKLLATVLAQPAESPRSWRPEIPRGLAAVVLRCLAKQPGERFGDYDELRLALLPYASAAPSPATLGLRCVAYVIDTLVLSLLAATLQFTFISNFNSWLDPQQIDGTRMAVFTIAVEVLWIAYFCVPEGLWGLTLGRLFCRLRVVGPDRSAPGIPRALLRGIIFHLMPLLPFGLAYLSGFDFSGIGTLVAAGFRWLLFLAIFVTARRRNGYAGLHDLASGTRIVAYEAFQRRPTLASIEDLPAVAASLPQVGSYHRLATLSESASEAWSLGYDTQLLRRVWIHTVPVGRPSVSTNRRGLGRVGRLRWLSGRRGPDENWDAYEAPSGQSLMEFVGKRRAWREVRFWLLDLAEELAAAARDGSSPDRLSPEQVWITAEGRAKLLDAAAPGIAAPSADRHQDLAPAGDSRATRLFLAQVGVAALEGHPPQAVAGLCPVPAAPLPIPARTFFATLGAPASLNDSVAQLRGLAQRAAEMTGSHRFLLLLALCVPSLAFLLAGFAAGLTFDRLFVRASEFGYLQVHLVAFDKLREHGWNGDGGHAVGPATADELRAYERFVAARFGPVVREPEQWNSPFATNTLDEPQRKLAEAIVEAYPQVSDDEFRAGEAVVRQALGNRADELESPFGQSTAVSFTFLAVVGWMLWMAVMSLTAAALFRGGLLLWALGLTIVRSDGADASRLRVFWRAIVAWSPLGLIPITMGLVVPLVIQLDAAGPDPRTLQRLGGLAGLAYVLLVVLSALIPRRGLPDRLAGTWLVPRL